MDEKVVISKMEITSPHGAAPNKTQTMVAFEKIVNAFLEFQQYKILKEIKKYVADHML